MKIFAKIRFFWDAVVIALVIALIMIPMIILFPQKKGMIMHRLNKVIIFLIGGSIEKVGELDSNADMFVMNHQGIIDIIGMEALQKNHLNWIAKKELFEMPLYGALLRNGDMISVNREDKKGLLKLIKDVKASLEYKNRAIAVFPEGTRANGQKLLPFKAGTRFIAKKLGLKVQPVVITGSKHLLDEHDRTAHSSTVKYTFLPTVDVKSASSDWYEEMQRLMQKTIDDEFIRTSRSR
jgi:1-acyl-sn-glycerol-3-phosphate acyltransferase